MPKQLFAYSRPRGSEFLLPRGKSSQPGPSARQGSIAAWLLLGLCWAGWPGNLPAHYIVLKDGYTLHGKLQRENFTFYDSASGTYMKMNRPEGFFMIDDGARRVYFSHRQVQAIQDESLDGEAELIKLQRPITRLDSWKLPGGQYAGFTPWNERWDRVLKLDADRGKVQISQHLSILTPYYARVDSKSYNWSPHYLTAEFNPDELRRIILLHPDIKITPTTKDTAKRRYKVFRFFVQAGMLEAAQAELDRIQQDLPDQKEQIEAGREELKKRYAAKLVDLVEQAQKAGRHDWVQGSVAQLLRQDLDEKLQVRVRILQASYETINKNLAQARRWLSQLPARVADSQLRAIFTDAAQAIRSQLNPDSIGRLEAFLTFAEQAEREPNRPEGSPEALMALAVSGWLLGNNAAETKVDTAARLWRTRELVLEYQRTTEFGARRQLLEEYEKGAAVPFDVLAQVIRSLPPAEPLNPAGLSTVPAPSTFPSLANGLSAAILAAQQMAPVARFSLEAELPWSVRKGPAYQVQLPPEYHLGRSYPVLFVLHDSGEKPEVMLQRWGLRAAQQGYLLVAPEWERGIQPTYQYTAEEHRAVVDVLRDLVRRFSIDPDRVFVTGLGEGGTMAYDVGLSHPDLFAGIIPMNGRPRFHIRSYRPNAQYLPFYVAAGEVGENAKDTRLTFENWIPKGYPALWVQYKHRGVEWFDGEVPYIFDWMNRKKRAQAFPLLGAEEFQSMRPSDNHFYWLSAEQLNERHVNDARTWSNKVLPATLQARVNEGNQISVNGHGFKRVTVWLGQGMIDFEKPVSVNVNSQLFLGNRRIRPSLAELLEDFYQRGDRERLYWAKLELTL